MNADEKDVTAAGVPAESDERDLMRHGEEAVRLLAVEGSRLYTTVWRRLAARLGWIVTIVEPEAVFSGPPSSISRPHDLVLLSMSAADPATPDLIRRLRTVPDYRATPLILATTAGETPTLSRLLASGLDAVVERADLAQVERALCFFQTILGPVPRVACIEDSRVAGHRILSVLAGRHRLHVEHHTDPADALSIHRREPYDIVLLDWTFPGPLQGPAITEALAEEGEPVILVLSDAEDLHHLPPQTAMWIDAVLPKKGIDAQLPWALTARLRELYLRRLLRARASGSFVAPPPP